jgi:hypothetical protein
MNPKELTIRGLVRGALITTIFTAANVYLGLKVGLTFASSIPAAMTVRYTIAPAGVAHVTMTGVAGPGDVIEFLRALAADPAHRPAVPQLVDMRGVTQAAAVADLERVASAFEQMRPHFAGARCAVVVATPLMFGTVRRFATLAECAGSHAAI